MFLLAVPAHALDPNKHITQYTHTSWRTQDGSAPSGMNAIAQTSDGFLWFLSPGGEVYNFDGSGFVRGTFLRRVLRSIGLGTSSAITQVGSGYGATGIAHLKNGVVTSHFQLEGLMPNPNNVSEDTDGSIWVVRGENGVSEPLCHVTELAIKCFGKLDGIPISPIDAILADGRGGFWLGGQTALVHWHSGACGDLPD